MRLCGTEDDVHERRREAAQGRQGDAGFYSGHPHGVTPDTVFLTFMYFESCNGIFLDMSGNNCNYGDFQGSRLTQKLPEMCPRDSI